MITDINGSSSTGTETTQTKSQAIGQDAFLKIFMAQLQHQDPLSPMEGTEFTSQLAQFSSLEQLFNVNNNLESIKGGQSTASRFEALSLIGKEISTDGDILYLSEGGTAKGSFDLKGDATCVAVVTNESGSTVRIIPLGGMVEGEQTFEWDGRSDAGTRMSPGTYRFSIAAVDASGKKVPVDKRISGIVDRVNLEGATPVAYIGDIPINTSQIQDIRSRQTTADSEQAEQ